MSTENTSAEILNDLIEINNDRIAGYQKAIENLKDEDRDLKGLFIDMIEESHNCKMELAGELIVLKGETENGTTTSGKLYRAWMDVKAVFTGHERKSVLENCEFGEDAAQKAYEAAINDDELAHHLKDMISLQKNILKNSHDKIKALRDQQA